MAASSTPRPSCCCNTWHCTFSGEDKYHPSKQRALPVILRRRRSHLARHGLLRRLRFLRRPLLLAARPHAGIRERGKADGTAIAPMDEKRPLAAAGLLPFVIAVRRNQAAPPLDGILERRLLQNRLGTCVDQERKFTGIFHPRRNQSPAHQPKMAAAIFQDDNRDWLSRRDIIPRREIGLLEIA